MFQENLKFRVSLLDTFLKIIALQYWNLKKMFEHESYLYLSIITIILKVLIKTTVIGSSKLTFDWRSHSNITQNTITYYRYIIVHGIGRGFSLHKISLVSSAAMWGWLNTYEMSKVATALRACIVRIRYYSDQICTQGVLKSIFISLP